MKILLEDTTEVANGVWLTFAAPHQLTAFSQAAVTRGRRSVLLAASPVFEGKQGTLVIDTENLSVLSIGTTPSTLVVDTIVTAEALESNNHPFDSSNVGPGDREFLLLAESELQGEAQEAGIELIREIRKKWPGDLKRGERNNFSNLPDNFWYVIVQPRVQALSITIRGASERFTSKTLELKTDRPGYTRFSIKTSDDLPEALRLIGESKQRSFRRI